MMEPAEIRETLEKADELVSELKAHRNLSPDSGNVTQITFSGEKSVLLSLLLGLVGGVCLGVAVMAAGWVGWALSDVRAEVRADRQEQAAMNNWIAQEVTAIRSYIANGKLQPMKPRPLAEESQPEKPQ